MLQKNYCVYIKTEKKARRFWKLAKKCGYSWSGKFENGGGPNLYWYLNKKIKRIGFDSVKFHYFNHITYREIMKLLYADYFRVGDRVRITRKATEKEMKRIENRWTHGMSDAIGKIGTTMKSYSPGHRVFINTKGYDYSYPPEVLEKVDASEKAKTPLVRGRWLTWKDQDYYAIEIASNYCEDPTFANRVDIIYKNRRYRLPKYIKVNDVLACSRTQLGPVWVMVKDVKNEKWGGEPEELYVVKEEKNYKFYTNTFFRYARLATPDEIQEVQNG